MFESGVRHDRDNTESAIQIQMIYVLRSKWHEGPIETQSQNCGINAGRTNEFGVNTSRPLS